MAEWYFNERRQGHPSRETIASSFFAEDKINEFAGAIVREGTQNSRDNRLDENKPVRIRLTIGTANFVSSGLDTALWEHVAASPGGGEQAARHRNDQECRYLVVEDFNATGLRGDVKDDRLRTSSGNPKENNEWNFFFHAEGISSKRHGKLGSWGVGKYAYLDASYINSIFAYTVRTDEEDPGPYLLGRSVIKNHLINDVEFTQDGFWANRIEIDAQGVIHEPFDSESEEMKSFLNTFSISRKPNEYGLSIVIPYITEELDCEQLIEVVLSNYAMMIDWGELEIEIKDEKGETHEFTAANIHGQLGVMGEKYPSLAELLPELEICREGREVEETEIIKVSRPDLSRAPGWGDENGLWLDEEQREKFIKKLNAGEVVSVSVPVYIRKTTTDLEEWSQFSIFFKQSDTEGKHNGRFFRRGLCISAESYSLRDLRSLVYIDDKALSNFLVDAEGPSHMRWNEKEDKFKGSYEYGPSWLRVIKNAPDRVLKLVKDTGDSEDYSLAKNFFSFTSSESDNKDEGDDSSGGSGEDENDEVIVDVPPSKKREFTVTPLSNGGFKCRIDKEQLREGDFISFDISYAGSAWKSCDFNFELNPSSIQITGGTAVDRGGNMFTVKIDDAEKFKVEVTGFDSNRDLEVKPTVETVERIS